jgi:hypothetical protein
VCGVGETKLNLEVPELGAPLHRIAEMLRMTAAAKAVLLLCAIALLAAGSGAADSDSAAGAAGFPDNGCVSPQVVCRMCVRLASLQPMVQEQRWEEPDHRGFRLRGGGGGRSTPRSTQQSDYALLIIAAASSWMLLARGELAN